ncbi:MAG: MaoC family dehydratase [Trebonia sp.]
MIAYESVDEFAARKGEVLGTSEWVTVSQEQINLFADATGDHSWIHVDTERAAAGPFGATIAHGLMTLAMVQDLSRQMWRVEGVTMIVNYGMNKVRFPAPVPTGSRVRAQIVLAGVEPVASGNAWQATLSVTVEIEGGTKPAVVSEVVLRLVS